MVSSAVAQAILNMPKPDLLGSFREGQEYRKGEQVKDLTARAYKGEEGAIDELAGIDPFVADQLGQAIGAKDKRQIAGFIEDARVGINMLQSGDVDSFIAFGNNRARAIRQRGGDPTQTLQAVELAKKDPQAALANLRSFTDSIDYAKKASTQKAEILPDGTTVQVMSDGTTSVTSPTGEMLTGARAAEQIKIARQYGADVKATESGGRRSAELEADLEIKPDLEAKVTTAKEKAKQSQEKVAKLLDQAESARSSVSIYDDMIAAIDDGADSGRLADFLPSVRSSTLQLNNLKNRLGLEVISTTTFGALSAPELKLAMETAVPPLPPAELKIWAQNKKAAQIKLANQMEEYAMFLDSGGTRAEWVDLQKKVRESSGRDNSPAEPQPKIDINALVNKYAGD